MGFAGDERDEIIQSAIDYISGENRHLYLEVPIGVLCDAGSLLLVSINHKEHSGDPVDLDQATLRKIEKVVPREILMMRRISDEDRLNKAGIDINYQDIDIIGSAALALSTEHIKDPKLRGALADYKRRYINSVLILQQFFVERGGRENEKLTESAQLALNQS